MSNVVGLPGMVARTFEPDAECIEYLELLLKEAKAGNLVAIATAGVGPQGEVSNGFKGNASYRSLGASIALMHHMFFATWNDYKGDEQPFGSPPAA